MYRQIVSPLWGETIIQEGRRKQAEFERVEETGANLVTAALLSLTSPLGAGLEAVLYLLLRQDAR